MKLRTGGQFASFQLCSYCNLILLMTSKKLETRCFTEISYQSWVKKIIREIKEMHQHYSSESDKGNKCEYINRIY